MTRSRRCQPHCFETHPATRPPVGSGPAIYIHEADASLGNPLPSRLATRPAATRHSYPQPSLYFRTYGVGSGGETLGGRDGSVRSTDRLHCAPAGPVVAVSGRPSGWPARSKQPTPTLERIEASTCWMADRFRIQSDPPSILHWLNSNHSLRRLLRAADYCRSGGTSGETLTSVRITGTVLLEGSPCLSTHCTRIQRPNPMSRYVIISPKSIFGGWYPSSSAE